MLEAKQRNVHSSKKTDVLDSIIVVATRLNLCSGNTGMKNNKKNLQQLLQGFLKTSIDFDKTSIKDFF